jgi:N-acyl homoserine lactone hydrolase
MRFWILPVGGFHTRADVLDPAGDKQRWWDIPVYAYLVDTGQGLFLFDTGCSHALRRRPADILGADTEILAPRLTEADHVTARLAALGFRPDDVDVVAVSHLHFDHAGGNEAFPHAEFWVQEQEWAAAMAPDAGVHYPDPAWKPSRPPRLVAGDVAAAPGVALLFTPGHTPGHQSLRVELADGPLVVTADAVYMQELFDPAHVGAAVDPAASALSVVRLKDLAARGERVFFSHDPRQWREAPWVRLAPAVYT